ncbi:unnamed protein product [Medioppia subpectinata]|uniref:C3H1-type domain-containing protein n=2 Tax=Medioppia subpectinata TaxID=1979941 RepID=A0A7R9PWW0_9ACAR|nr:unnamed protein product [Medioppia subpectinata]CAG2103725.1 unnamed protein product [Medioppia subpectinata]
MIVENTEAFRHWLKSCLEPLCDADPEALAKYVMALIKKDKPEKDLKIICLDQLEVFLSSQTITFVETLFEAIGNKSYLNSAPTAPPVPTPTPSITVAPKATIQLSAPSVQSEASSSSTVMKNPEISSVSNTNSRSEQQSNSQSTTKTESTHESNKPRDKRNRSRSRSRSPLRNTRRNEFDTRRLGPMPNNRNGNTYFNDDRRNRRGNGNNRRAGSQRFGGNSYRNERDYRRGPKRGRSPSPRSFSSGSASPNRSRSRSWSGDRDRHSPSNKRSRPASRPASRSPSPSKANTKDAEKSKKCRDYEEKGFCLKGHLCPYDHGNDPVVLDSNVSAALGFTNTNPTGAPMHPMPGPGIPPNAPNSYLAEPYNPEAPGMDPNVQRPHPPPPGGPPPLGPRMPPPPHYWGPMPMRGPMPGGPPLPPPQFMPPPGRPRELIGVPTIDNNVRHNQPLSNRTVIEPNIPMGGMRGGMRGGYKHMGRGGYRNVRRVTNDNSDKTCLEVRKIPHNMNSISHLNQHFSKFGTIVNLQVCHEGDPEAALVQYASHNEALSAIRSTEAVLNNRFIKVFWRSKDQQQTHEQTFGPKTESTDETVSAKSSIKDRLGPKVSETESVLTAVNSSGTISRTVFDPSKLKKNNTNVNKDTANDINSKSVLKPTSMVTKNAANEKTNKTQKQIYSKQYNLLKELITNQKQLMTKLEKSTNENEKTSIKETIDAISTKIQVLYDSISKVMSDKKIVKKPQTKEELMEELLDTDLDMFIKMQNNDMSYVELANKFAKLKKKEKTFSHRGGGGRGGVRTYAQRRGRGAYPRRGAFSPRGTNPLLKVDRRTRKLLIPDINEDDMTDLLEHLAQFSDVEVIEPSSSGALVTFKTRVDAERATQNMSQIKFKENLQLTYSWFDDKISKLDKNTLTKNISESKSENDGNDRELEGLGEELLDFEEDDTEDESEARNWKA